MTIAYCEAKNSSDILRKVENHGGWYCDKCRRFHYHSQFLRIVVIPTQNWPKETHAE